MNENMNMNLDMSTDTDITPEVKYLFFGPRLLGHRNVEISITGGTTGH
jgi:hypothetical protein